MEFYAHKSDSGETQTLKEHLSNVAMIASDFAVDFMKPLAYETGKAHDIGKYSIAFQERLNGGSAKFEHSSCGAIEYSKLGSDNKEKLIALMMQYCIAGHHTGLPDGGNKYDSAFNDVTLHSRLKRGEQYIGKSDYSSYKKSSSFVFPMQCKCLMKS